MAVQQFCLRWNNHQPNFISVFTDLLNKESLVDVTLAAEGKQLQAHKVVLSACSTYFQTLFTSNPCQHPIVILKDIKFNDLKIMVDFMYYGEVNVSQDQLPAILKTAETLKVKGLAEMPEGVSLSKSESQGSESPWSPGALRRKRLRKSSTGSSEQTSTEDAAGSVGSIAPSPLVKQEPGEPTPTRDPSTESDTARSQSFETDDQPPNTPSRTLSEDLGDSNIRWSSSEEQKSGCIMHSQNPTQVRESGSSVSGGSKSRRLLIRQHRIKKESEGGGGEGDEGGGGGGGSGGGPRMERHSSEPGPQHHLAVPHYLPKQNSSPHLSPPVQNTATPPQVHVTPPTPTSPPPPSDQQIRQEPRRPNPPSSQCPVTGGSSGNSSSTPVVEAGQCEGSRSCHCPALRPGPALGCNFCWNTIDTHGRILRRKTKYHCPDCQTNLCIVPCFQEYHERQTVVNSGSGSGSSSSTKDSTGTLFTSVGFPTIMKTSSL